LAQFIRQALDDVVGVPPLPPSLVIHGQNVDAPINDVDVPGRIDAIADLDGAQFRPTSRLQKLPLFGQVLLNLSIHLFKSYIHQVLH
jgi:hypothetical protein